MCKQKIEYVTLRKNGNSLYMRVPVGYIRENELVAGDIAVWSPGEKLRFVKQAQLEELVSQAEELETAT
jgi:antitoxin component of MazEF toxin-antitoxin module